MIWNTNETVVHITNIRKTEMYKLGKVVVKSGSRAVHDSREVLTGVTCVNAGGKVTTAHLSIPVNNFMAMSWNRLTLCILESIKLVQWRP